MICNSVGLSRQRQPYQSQDRLMSLIDALATFKLTKTFFSFSIPSLATSSFVLILMQFCNVLKTYIYILKTCESNVSCCQKEDGSDEGSDQATAFDVVFESTKCLQKFTSKSEYEEKFVWVDFATRSLHLSEHQDKNRKHKEASIADVGGVLKGLPKKKPNDMSSISEDRCLIISFRTGGGIDLCFDTMAQRDEWAEDLQKILEQFPTAN